jgi:LmbE family N-acetylglucosaminyl deacetylase
MASHPGAYVVTVFAGNPPAYPTDPMRKWDVQSGFSPGDDVMETRRHEDAAALDLLDATPVHLEFVEHTYNPGDRPVAPDVLVDGLAPALAALAPTVVLAPFGLANPDHDVTHHAARRLMDERPAWAWYCYEDAGYCHLPGLLAWRVAALFRAGRWPTPAILPVEVDHDRKRRALECYRSQLPPLRADHRLDERLAAPAPEQHWRIAAPPAGWEGLADAPG